MVSKTGKAFCVLSFARSQSVIITVQNEFWRKYHTNNAPTSQSIRRWYNQFQVTGCLCKHKGPGQPGVSSETVERVRETFLRSPKKSTVRASRELGIPQSTIWTVLRRKLHFKPYKLQTMQTLKPNDKLQHLKPFHGCSCA